MKLSNFVMEEMVDATPMVALPPATATDMVTDNHEIDEDLDMLEESVVATEGLLTIRGTLAKHQNIGLSPNTAKITMISMENLFNRLGIPMNDAMPSLEHFESKHTTKQATQISLESVTEKISKIFTAFVDMMKRVIANIFKFVQQIFDNAEAKRVEQYQRAIKSEVDRLSRNSKDTRGKTQTNNELTITNQQLLSAFHDPAEGINDAVVLKIAQNVQRYLDFLLEASEIMSGYFDEVVTTLKKFEDNINAGNYQETYGNGERMDTHLIGYVSDIVNLKTIVALNKHCDGSKDPHKPVISNPAMEPQGRMALSGLMCHGVRFAFYHTKNDYEITCEKMVSPAQYASGSDTIYKLPGLTVANQLNEISIDISTKMAKLGAIVNQKHCKFEQMINTALGKLSVLVHGLENQIDDADYQHLYSNMEMVMSFMTKVFQLYKNAYVAGLSTIKTGLDSINMMTKAIVTGYQNQAKNQTD